MRPATEGERGKRDLELTCPVIIARHGGLDGVAMQKEEYLRLLKHLDVHIHVLAGREENGHPGAGAGGPTGSVIDRLDFCHPDSELLFANAFACGPETDGARRIDRDEWLAVFARHKSAIRDAIERGLATIPHNTPVIVFNLLALRHLHPAAAVAIREVIERHPDRGFLSHAADPDAERPEKIARLKDFVRDVISARDPSEPYDGGPYRLNNLYHIVLNPTQRANFILNHGVREDHVYEIPDFLDFPARGDPVVADRPEPEFVPYLARHGVVPDGGRPAYRRTPVDEKTVFFLSPVRPVYRKRLREAMLVAHEYGRTRGEKVAFVVTHPNVDDRDYFVQTVDYAGALGLPYIHVGEGCTFETLDRIYRNMAALRSVGVVASSAGGWENAVNEMARECIPFFMSSGLNSFEPLTVGMGVRAHGMRFAFLQKLVEHRPVEELRDCNLSLAPGMTDLCGWIDRVLDGRSRRKLVEHNYRKVRRHLSHRATAARLWEAILKIYARHGLPGRPGAAVEA